MTLTDERRMSQIETLINRARAAEDEVERLTRQIRSLQRAGHKSQALDIDRLRSANEALTEQVRVLTLANKTFAGEA